MKIQEETVWSDVWPVVESLIQAVLAEDVEQVRPLLEPNSIADDMLDLYGYYVYDILLKSVLGRDKLAVTRAVETENGRFLHIEYAWPDVTTEDNHYTANDVVTATLTEKEDGKWLITDVNPSAIDLPLNGGRARGVIAGGQSLSEDGKVPGERGFCLMRCMRDCSKCSCATKRWLMKLSKSCCPHCKIVLMG